MSDLASKEMLDLHCAHSRPVYARCEQCEEQVKAGKSSGIERPVKAGESRCPSCDTNTPNHFSWCELPSSPREASACTCPPGYCCEASGAARSAQRICRQRGDQS